MLEALRNRLGLRRVYCCGCIRLVWRDNKEVCSRNDIVESNWKGLITIKKPHEDPSKVNNSNQCLDYIERH